MLDLPDFSDIISASGVLSSFIHKTPVLHARFFDEKIGAQLFFKCENFQRTGAFKFRGAINALSSLSSEERGRGVVTWSSGNHAQAIALAGRRLKIKTTIVMPQNAPPIKLEATRGYGGNVVLYNPDTENREEIGRRIASETGAVIIPPYDHPKVIAGQGTACKELIEEIGTLDYIFTPCGGGGLLSGTALSAKALLDNCKVIGVEPALADDATRSFKTGKLQTISNPKTVADGARTPFLGEYTFPLIQQNVFDMMTVSEAEILSAMFLVWERLKIVIEPTSALPVAGVLKYKDHLKSTDKVGVIITGGNVDLAQVSAWKTMLEKSV